MERKGRAAGGKCHRGVYCREMEDDFMVMHRSCSSSRLSIKRSCAAQQDAGKIEDGLVLKRPMKGLRTGMRKVDAN